MAESAGEPKDLFGDPWTPPRDPRGRKRHRRTPQVAEKVGELRSAGTSQEDIALFLGLSVPTLRKYYFRELELGPDLVTAELHLTLLKKAKGGSVPAIRLALELLARGKAAVPVTKGKAAEKLGKKEQAALDAVTAHEGTGWGDLLPH